MGSTTAPHPRRHRIDDARCLRDALRYELGASEGRLRKLPAESELVERFGCSRNAVREALNLLLDEHLIERRQGVGTLAVRAAPPHVTTPRPCGLVHEIADGPTRVRYQALEIKEVGSSGAIGSLLGLADGAPLVVLPRLTVVDGAPTCLWDTFVPRETGLRLAASPSAGDTYELFREALGIEAVDAHMLVEAVIADASVADLLEVEVGQPLLRFERIISDRAGKVVALSFGRARADRVAISWSPQPTPLDAKRD